MKPRDDGPNIASTPNRVPWPPLLFISAIVAALALDAIVPVDGVFTRPSWQWLVPVGWSGLALGGLMDLWAMLTLARAKANILPHRAATRLVTWGPYRFSRNPIYLGNTLMTASAGLAFAKPWLLPAAGVAAFATLHLAILREEAHVAAKFGDAWRAYAAQTARWLSWPH